MRQPYRAIRRTGFTLIELIVVMAILIVIASLTIGAVSKSFGWIKQKNTEQTMTKVIQRLQRTIDRINKEVDDWPPTTERLILDQAAGSFERARVLKFQYLYKWNFPNTYAEAFHNVDGKKMTEDFVAAAKWLKARSDSTHKLGAVGFCFGGGMVNQLAVRLGPDLNAGVAFYGRQAGADDVPKISAPLLLQYAGNDQRVNEGIPAYEAALKANNKVYQVYMYDGKQHGFHNDTTPRYDEEAAKLAWSRTLEWFKKYLR